MPKKITENKKGLPFLLISLSADNRHPDAIKPFNVCIIQKPWVKKIKTTNKRDDKTNTPAEK